MVVWSSHSLTGIEPRVHTEPLTTSQGFLAKNDSAHFMKKGLRSGGLCLHRFPEHHASPGGLGSPGSPQSHEPLVRVQPSSQMQHVLLDLKASSTKFQGFLSRDEMNHLMLILTALEGALEEERGA